MIPEGFELTKEEQKAIASLKRLAKNWPERLWLYSANSILCVMKKRENGETPTDRYGGIDPDYAVATIDIPNDGGDFG